MFWAYHFQSSGNFIIKISSAGFWITMEPPSLDISFAGVNILTSSAYTLSGKWRFNKVSIRGYSKFDVFVADSDITTILTLNAH